MNQNITGNELQLYKSFYTTYPDAILVLQDGVIIVCNELAQALFQVDDKQELTNKTLSDFALNDSQNEVESLELEHHLNKCLLEGKDTFEWKFLNRKGEKVDVKVFLSKIVIDEKTLIQVILRNIENNSIKKQEQELKAITDALDRSAIISIADTEGKIIKVNEEFCRISQYSEKELLGQDHRIVNSAYHPKEFWQEMWQAVTRGKTWRADVRNKAKDGSFYWVDTVINPILNTNNKITSYLSIRYLITDRKKQELEIQVNQEQLQTTEEELRQNLEELETQRDYIQEINKQIKIKSEVVERNSQALLELNKSKEIYAGNLDVAFELITKKVAQTLNIERVGIWQYDTTNEVKIICQKQYETTKDGYVFSQNAEVKQEDTPKYFADILTEKNIVADFAPNHPALIEFVDNYLIPLQINSMLDVPYFIDGKLAGVICCETQRQYKNWTDEDIAFVKGISDSITITIKTQHQLEEQEKVRQNEKLLYQFLNNIPIGVNIFSKSGDIFFVNDITKQMFGHDIEEKATLYNKNATAVQTKLAGTNEDYPKDKFPHVRALKGEFTRIEDLEVVQDSKRTLVEAHGAPIYSEKGEIEFAISVFQDITERKEKELEIKKKNEELATTEEELRQNLEELQTTQEALLVTQLEQEKLVSIIKNVDAFVAIADLKGKIEFLNERGKQLSGFFEDYKGRFISDFHTEESAKIAKEVIIPTVMKEGVWRGEHRLQNHVTKKAIDTLANIFIIRDPNTKQPIALATVQLDITDQKDLERSIQDQNQRLQASEEELRQNMEELEATQEAMREKQTLIEESKIALEKQNQKLLANESILKKTFEKMKLQEAQLKDSLGSVQAQEEELRQNMEELEATQEAMLQKQKLVEEAKISLEKQNQKLASNEAVLKKAFEKMKVQDLKLRESLDALQTQEEELRQNMEELQTTQEVLAYQKDILELSNRQITKSISYAETIQKAILPSKKLIKEVLPESFVIYKPKDIVSGDFYWLSQHNNKTLIGVIDCTGHGVPGAFMSLVASNILSEIINQKGILQPNLILNELHKGVVKKLNQKEGANNDGMDLTLCLVEKTRDNQTQLTFAGVKQNLYIVRNKELIELKGNRGSIGGGKRDDQRNYTQEEIILQKNDAVFLATDGYADQADKDRKSFSKKSFRELLIEVGCLSAKEQMKILEQRLAQHQKEIEQRDDITVLGFKI